MKGGQDSSPDGQSVQLAILEQLQKMAERLDQVEGQMVASSTGSTPVPRHELSTDSFVKSFKSKKSKRIQPIITDSSSEDSKGPTIEVLKSKCLQQKVDSRIRELDLSSHSPSNSRSKLKSQRGGPVEVVVKQKVHWPHEAILGGVKGSCTTICP